LIFVLQLLPIKQAVRYFCFDTPIAEETADINEAAAKKINVAVEDDHFLTDHLYMSHPGLLINNKCCSLYTAMLPSSHAVDIETPPPNVVIG